MGLTRTVSDANIYTMNNRAEDVLDKKEFSEIRFRLELNAKELLHRNN